MRRFVAPCLAWLSLVLVAVANVPVAVLPVTADRAMVVAGHPQAVEAGLSVLHAGGNAIDAAVATSLALGVAEPFGSGLGGKLMLLFYEAKTGRTFAVDAMDAAGSIDLEAYSKRPEEQRSYGYGAVCVPGLPAGLWAAHQRWGGKKWADVVQPAIALARSGFRVLPKTRDFMEEQERKLRRGDLEVARLYLPGGALPEAGSLLANEDLARTMERYAEHGRDGFYRGPVAEAIVAASEKGGGSMTLEDFAAYEARIAEPITASFRGYTFMCAPPPASGAVLFLSILKMLESEPLRPPLRAAENLDLIGRAWRVVLPEISRTVGDAPQSRFLIEKLFAPDSIAELRAKAWEAAPTRKKVARADVQHRQAATSAGEGTADRALALTAPAEPEGELLERVGMDEPFYESPMAATTHFVVVDRDGNVVCATQSQSLHFGAGVVPPGTGVVMNNTMSNFTFSDPRSLNFVAPGRRPRSTISPTLVLRDGKPHIAIGLPGSSRIPTAMLQVLLDRLVFNRPLADAIGDTRVHYYSSYREPEDLFEAEQSFPSAEAQALQARGWKVLFPEAAGRGRHFGGINAVEFNPDGTLTGYADPRRTNAAAGF